MGRRPSLEKAARWKPKVENTRRKSTGGGKVSGRKVSMKGLTTPFIC